jgi:hypothetical protein
MACGTFVFLTSPLNALPSIGSIVRWSKNMRARYPKSRRWTFVAATVFGIIAMARFAGATPIAEYKLDEGTGTSATDSSGNGYTGTITNGTYTTTAAQGPYALSLAGSGFVATPSGLATALAATNAFTIDAWIDVTTSTAQIQSIASNTPSGGGGSGFNFYVNTYSTSDHTLDFETGGNRLFSTSPIPNLVGNYHNVAVTVSNANPTTGSVSVALYVDGQAVATTGSVNNSINLTAVNLRFGTFTDGALGFTGNLDDVQVYNSALTAAQVASLPEPSSICLLGLTAVGMLKRRRARDCRSQASLLP